MKMRVDLAVADSIFRARWNVFETGVADVFPLVESFELK
jgi:hypothetical protein